ncbi:MAG: hypothetical protein WCF84_14245 [Anaerolineae bacterium]
MNRYVLTLIALALMLAITSACDSTQLGAFNNATETPTRTPRPTFTPRPSATTIPSATATEAATDTPAPTDTLEAQATDTVPPQPTKTKVSPKPVQPTNPPAPPKPILPIYPDNSYGNGLTQNFCGQGGSVYEIIVYMKMAGDKPRAWATGYTFGVFAPDGTWLTDYNKNKLISPPTDDARQAGTGFGYNCLHGGSFTDLEKYNGKLDVGDAVRAGNKTMILRFVKSSTDPTPLSPDITLDFSQTGRWWLWFGVQ